MRKFYVISAIALLVLSACERVDTTGSREEEIVLDSLVTVLAPPPGMHSLDILVYEAGGLKRLQASVRVVAGKEGVGQDAEGCLKDSVRIKLPIGDKIIGVVGDSPYGFKSSALGTFDALSQLTVLYYDEDKSRPLRSGQFSCQAGDTVKLALHSLLVPLQLTEISHEFQDYECLENPKVILRDAASSVEIFRENGFRPSETVSDTLGMRGLMWDKLPSDIGYHPQKPCLRLYCYPNDDGPTKTRFTVEGKYKGRTARFEYELPSLKLGYMYSINLLIGESPTDYEFSLEMIKNIQ